MTLKQSKVIFNIASISISIYQEFLQLDKVHQYSYSLSDKIWKFN